jgi:hypothetical protein
MAEFEVRVARNAPSQTTTVNALKRVWLRSLLYLHDSTFGMFKSMLMA